MTTGIDLRDILSTLEPEHLAALLDRIGSPDFVDDLADALRAESREREYQGEPTWCRLMADRRRDAAAEEDAEWGGDA